MDCCQHLRLDHGSSIYFIQPLLCLFKVVNIFNSIKTYSRKVIQDYRNSNPLLVKILQKYEIHMMPLTNPDGYEYSHNTVSLSII